MSEFTKKIKKENPLCTSFFPITCEIVVRITMCIWKNFRWINYPQITLITYLNKIVFSVSKLRMKLHARNSTKMHNEENALGTQHEYICNNLRNCC